MNITNPLIAGAAVADITPKDSQFLYGYPHVERYSEGVHDPLLSSALCISNNTMRVLFIANDIIYIAKDLAKRARDRIADAADVPPGHIMITATHTHSGPIVDKMISNDADPAVPDADPEYVQLLEDGIVRAGVAACRAARPAQIGFSTADGHGVGTNRRDPEAPADAEVPVLLVRTEDGRENLACMLVCSMHPTVLHEDSKLVSADFPGMARQYLQKNVLGATCPVLHHMGPSGNQSPRHVIRANTFEEAERLGTIFGRSLEAAITRMTVKSGVELACMQGFVDLPQKEFTSVPEAEAMLKRARDKLRELQESHAPWSVIRTAECDLFGAEESVSLARASMDGRIAAARRKCLPAEIQVTAVGPWRFVGWQGEMFVEYALRVKERHPDSFVISCANGTLQGYVVTPEALAEGGYEASNGLFPPEAGAVLVDETDRLLSGLHSG